MGVVRRGMGSEGMGVEDMTLTLLCFCASGLLCFYFLLSLYDRMEYQWILMKGRIASIRRIRDGGRNG